MASLIPMAVGIGENNAQRHGGNSGFGTGQSFINALDPLNLSGKASSSVLGNVLDPGNVIGLNMGMATNPRLGGGASTAAASSVPGTLPNLGINPRLYNPTSFMNPALSGGQWNQQAQGLAGPVYSPTVLSGKGSQTGQMPMAAPGRMPIPIGAMPYNRFMVSK